MPLDTVIQNRRWRRHVKPFIHIHGANVLTPDSYAAVEAAFNAILQRGLSETGDGDRLSRRMNNYTAYSMSLGPQEQGALALFTSRDWHNMVGGLFNTPLTGEIDISLHHHPAGSGGGWLHTDYSPGWFVDNANADGIHLSSQEHGLYKTGRTTINGVGIPRQRMRGIAMLFYLCNPDWQAGDGGETGLYGSVTDPVEQPSGRIPPVNNSIVLFECTPFSYHTFMGNPRRPRNAIVWWAHRDFDKAVQCWGKEKVSWWR